MAMALIALDELGRGYLASSQPPLASACGRVVNNQICDGERAKLRSVAASRAGPFAIKYLIVDNSGCCRAGTRVSTTCQPACALPDRHCETATCSLFMRQPDSRGPARLHYGQIVAVLLGLRTPPANALGDDAQSTATPEPVAAVFHARERPAANAWLIRFSAAKSSNGCRTSAASALPAALLFLGLCQRRWQSSLALLAELRSVCFEQRPTSNKIAITLYAGASGSARIPGLPRLGDHPLAPASLVDRSCRPSTPHNNGRWSSLAARNCKVRDQHLQVIELQGDAVGRQQAKRAVGGSFLHVSLASCEDAAVISST
ncbi:hypothetical protein OPT61_g2145 [Boeremia exigua]|uniref:Uncharacterized protein n=1 Tax=Boeremia exigua TaxID=749465 RepID=A0ACC2IMJ8_9PLEO|nr:hypothetical protein OPT61_g2145 [Boeremia exigua]